MILALRVLAAAAVGFLAGYSVCRANTGGTSSDFKRWLNEQYAKDEPFIIDYDLGNEKFGVYAANPSEPVTASLGWGCPDRDFNICKNCKNEGICIWKPKVEEDEQL